MEIKCPFCKRLEKLDSETSKFYLKKTGETGDLKLDNNHMYHYQIQTQLGVCKELSSYFVVWTEQDLHIEVVDFDPVMWSEICEKSEVIFKTAILPEVTGKFMTRVHAIEAKESSQLAPKDHSYL